MFYLSPQLHHVVQSRSTETVRQRVIWCHSEIFDAYFDDSLHYANCRLHVHVIGKCTSRTRHSSYLNVYVLCLCLCAIGL